MAKKEITIFNLGTYASQNQQDNNEPEQPMTERKEVWNKISCLKQQVNFRFRTRLRTVVLTDVLKAFAENAMRATREYVDYYFEVVMKSIKLLRSLKDEASNLGPAVVKEMRQVTRHLPIPPERRALLFPMSYDALKEITESINCQISAIESIHEQIAPIILKLAEETHNALTGLNDYASSKHLTEVRNRHTSFDCRRVVSHFMGPHYDAINSLKDALSQARTRIYTENSIFEASIKKTQTQLEQAIHVAEPSSGQMGSYQYRQLRSVFRKAMDFTARRELFQPEYNIDSALLQLESLYHAMSGLY